MRRVVVLCFLLSSAAAGVFAQATWDEWRTIDTVHYSIHFPARFETWARHAAGSIESIHEAVTGLVGYAPGPRIDVVIADPLADANGSAIPYLDRPRIGLQALGAPAESAHQRDEGAAAASDVEQPAAGHRGEVTVLPVDHGRSRRHESRHGRPDSAGERRLASA